VDSDTSFRELSAEFWRQQWRWWHRLGPPLRPGHEDVTIFQRLVAEWGPRAPRALQLGVTPELATMRWPEGTRLLAVDRSDGMIEHVWPAQPYPGACVVLGDWCNLVLADASVDVIVGDGCFMQQPYPRGYAVLAAELRRVLAPGGVFVMRAFVRPTVPETVDALLAELAAGRITQFHVFKWRLNMALQRDPESGVCLHEIWRSFYEAFSSVAQLAERTGWPLESIETIDAYRESDARYTYPSLAELSEAVAPYFTERQRHLPRYELGERCPILAYSGR
jgi:SAM-dependent methyltransferase